MERNFAEDPAEAVELFNYIANEFRYYSRMVSEFKRFETERKWGDFVEEHCEARLMYIANEAAMGYVREYVGRDARYRDIFSLAMRRECAAMMAKEFLVETAAGNSWL